MEEFGEDFFLCTGVVVVDLLYHPADLEKWRDPSAGLEKWKHGRVIYKFVHLLYHPADLEKWRDPSAGLEKWKHGRVIYKFVHEHFIYKFVIRDHPADLEKRKLMHWIRHTESISCLELLDIGWVNMSARYYYKEIAELYEQEQNLGQTIVYYERAADLFQNNPKAIEIYEDIARQLLNNNLLKYGVRGIFLTLHMPAM